MPVVGVCTSAKESILQALLSKLDHISDYGDDTTVKFIQLPHNDLDSFRLEPGSMDGLILCHSINNVAISDVMDALYDNFVSHASSVLGKANLAVIAHDFAWPMGSKQSNSPEDHAQDKQAQMDSFRIRQPTTFQRSSLAMVCGKLDTEVQMDDEDWQRLEAFVANVRPRSQQDKASNLEQITVLTICLVLVVTLYMFIFHVVIYSIIVTLLLVLSLAVPKVERPPMKGADVHAPFSPPLLQNITKQKS